VSRIRYDRLPTERVNPGTGKLDRLSAALLEHETLERDRLDGLLGARAVRRDVLPVLAPLPGTRSAMS